MTHDGVPNCYSLTLYPRFKPDSRNLWDRLDLLGLWLKVLLMMLCQYHYSKCHKCQSTLKLDSVK